MNMKLVGITLLLMGLASVVMAAAPTVPEISPVSAGSAVALVAGAVLIMRGRRKK
jgi:hypothetical protein